MKLTKQYIYERINQQGFFLAYNLTNKTQNTLLDLISKKKLISLAEISATKKYMSSNCMYTYADNRLKLKIAYDEIGNSFISRGSNKIKKQK